MDSFPANQGPVEHSFIRIKQGLDPTRSYIIFEHDLKHRGKSIFDPSHRIYAYLKKKKMGWQQVIDMDLAMEYLVIQVPAGKEDAVLGKILGFGFSEHIVFYIFKAEEV
ncbi:MAG: hypothetical protein MI863_26500 [Desulfobacterales bacterium]|nr:hypothetical protein [Desulfobacterales bacterium]